MRIRELPAHSSVHQETISVRNRFRISLEIATMKAKKMDYRTARIKEPVELVDAGLKASLRTNVTIRAYMVSIGPER